MFDDILGNGKEEIIKEDKDSLIESLKYNLEKKEEIIKNLIKEITDLEQQLENINQQIFGMSNGIS